MEGMFPATVKIETVKVTCTDICPVCGKVEVQTLDVPGWFGSVLASETHALCDTCRAEADRKEAEEYRLKRIDVLMAEAKIPQQFVEWNSEIGNVELARVIWHVRNCNLFISGFYSCGKTRCVVRNMIEEIKKGKSCRFWRFPELAAKYAEVCRTESNAQAWLKRQFRKDLVVIDDICKRRITDTAGEMLYDILDWLYSGEIQCRLWITSNKNLADTAKFFQNADMGDAFISRIDRMADDYDGRMKIIQAK